VKGRFIKNVGRRDLLAGASAAAAATLLSLPALALPKIGTSRPAVHLTDAWDRDLDLSAFKRPILLTYEDKDSAKQNQALKDDLDDLQKTSNYRKAVANIPVIDASGYDYWPAKGIVKGELRKWSNKLGIVLYPDFSGDVRTTLSLEKGTSNVVLYGATGEVLLAYSGKLADADRSKVIEKIKSFL
jgi:hypothetical protein